MSAADTAEITLKKLLDDVENTSEHRQDQMEKKKKLLTQVERLKRGRDNHPILNGCSPSAQIKERVTQKTVPKLFETRRNQIHKYYWSLTKENQNIWFSHMVETITPVRPRKKTTGKKDLLESIIWRMTKDQKVRVCQKMFLSTIGLTTDKAIGTVLSKVEVPGQMMYLIKGEKLNLQTKKR